MLFKPFDEADILTSDETPVADNLFRDGFVSSFTMILLAEIADKTFFIAAIMGTVSKSYLMSHDKCFMSQYIIVGHK